MIAGLLGFIWMMATAVQTRLIAKDAPSALLFVWAASTSLIWGYLIREVTVDPSSIPIYAVGSALGCVVAVKIVGRWLDRLIVVVTTRCNRFRND